MSVANCAKWGIAGLARKERPSRNQRCAAARHPLPYGRHVAFIVQGRLGAIVFCRDLELQDKRERCPVRDRYACAHEHRLNSVALNFGYDAAS